MIKKQNNSKLYLENFQENGYEELRNSNCPIKQDADIWNKTIQLISRSLENKDSIAQHR